MSNYGRRAQRRDKKRQRQRRQEIPPEAIPRVIDQPLFTSFAGGYNSSDSREDVPQESSPFCEDIEVSRKDRLVRAPGTVPLNSLAGRSVQQLAVHASLDFRSELLLFSPPFLGVKRDADIDWQDHSLPEGKRYAWTNFGGSFIFSDGADRVWVRQPNEETLADLKALGALPARAYETFAARVFTGNTYIDGNREPMGMAWSASDSNYEHWLGHTGSGFELLINELSAGDEIVTLKSMGLDFMAIVCRRSIWIGRRTGLRDRPADFQPRVPNIGTVNADTVRTTRLGIAFLALTGVYLFDGNTAQHISPQIDNDLLPLDLENLDGYSSMYDPTKGRYFLFTPTGTWIYEIDYNRWLRRSMVAKLGTPFAEQSPFLVWDEATGTWDDQTLTWDDLAPRESIHLPLLFLGEMGPGIERLDVESIGSILALDQPVGPTWEFKLSRGPQADLLFTTKRILYEYLGSGTLAFQLPNNAGQYKNVLIDSVAVSAVPRLMQADLSHTGRGVGVRLLFVDGAPEVAMVQLGVLPRGRRIYTSPTERQHFPDFSAPV
jgi:hypothetical protein